MARYPAQQKTIIIREIKADTYATFFDYWFDTERLTRQCDKLHTIWSGPAPTREENFDD
jgi:hypothetical protein